MIERAAPPQPVFLDTAVIEAAALVRRFLALTPLLWAFGVLTPAGALLVCWLAMQRWPSGGSLANLVSLTWIGVGGVQALAAALAWAAGGESIFVLGEHLLSMSVLGWIFIGLAVAAGHALRLNGSAIVRGVTYLGLSIIVFGAVAILASRAGMARLTLPSAVGSLLPDRPAVAFYFTMHFFTAEESFGSVLPRLILFFPWATALSLGGIGVLLVSLLEERRMWRALGVVGGFIGVVLSFSRIGLLMCIVCLTVLWWTGSSRLARWTAIAATWVALSIVLFSGVDLMALAAEMLGAAYEARSGASLGRQLIYERSWEGFLTSPIFGHGSIGGSILATEVLPIGSHSSVVGLLYTGGLVTFVVFSIALTVTLLATGQAALRGGRPERVAFALVVALVGYAPVESLFSFSLPCLFVFFWIGAALPAAVVHTDGRFPSGGAPVVGDARA